MSEPTSSSDDHKPVCERCQMQKASVDETGHCLVCRDYLTRGR